MTYKVAFLVFFQGSMNAAKETRAQGLRNTEEKEWYHLLIQEGTGVSQKLSFILHLLFASWNQLHGKNDLYLASSNASTLVWNYLIPSDCETQSRRCMHSMNSVI